MTWISPPHDDTSKGVVFGSGDTIACVTDCRSSASDAAVSVETVWDAGLRQQRSAAVLAFAAALEENTHLTRLDLSKNSVSDDGVLALFASMRKNRTIKALELTGNNVVTPKGREVLTQMTVRKNKRANKTRKLLGK